MAQCMFPYPVERKIFHSQEDRIVYVPCGKCPTCLKRRSASWSFRLEMESMLWLSQHFVTLTYDVDHVPISRNGFMTLDRPHLTNFIKRLRKRVGKLKYYAVGEYGTNSKRPHYHLILFGTSSMEEIDIINSWRDPDTQKFYGNVYFGKVEPASIRYCVQYYDKGNWYKLHARDDRLPEFSAMSNGIGRNFLTEKMVKHFLDNPEKGFIYDREGRKIAIPRYYKKRLYDYLASKDLVYNHPSILIHRDDMVEAKKVHNNEMKIMIDSLPQPEDSEQKNEGRRMAILNYQRSKRKTRK